MAFFSYSFAFPGLPSQTYIFLAGLRAAPRAARRRAPRGFRAVPMKDYYLPGVHAEELLVAADFGDALRVKALVEKGAATLPHQLPCALVPRSPFA